MNLGFYAKVIVNLLLPAVLAALAVVISLVALMLRHRGERRIERQLQQLHPDVLRASSMSGMSSSGDEGGTSRAAVVPTSTSLCRKLWNYFFVTQQFVSTSIFILFLCYNLIGTQVMSVLRCHHTPIGGVYYLSADFSIVCYDAQHWLMVLVAVSFGSVFCLGLPLFMIEKLRKHRAKATNPVFFSQYGFLIDGYRPETSW